MASRVGWRGIGDSNPWLPARQAGTLAAELMPRNRLVCVAGFEPAASCLRSRRSAPAELHADVSMHTSALHGTEAQRRIVKERGADAAACGRATYRMPEHHKQKARGTFVQPGLSGVWLLRFVQVMDLHECPGCVRGRSRLASGRARSFMLGSPPMRSVPGARVPAVRARPSGRGSRVVVCSAYIVRAIRSLKL